MGFGPGVVQVKPGRCGSGPVRVPLKSPVFSAAVGTLAEEHLTPSLTTPLLRPEEENPVLNNRAIEVATEVVVFQLWFGLTGPVEEEAIRVERIISIELEQSAMELDWFHPW